MKQQVAELLRLLNKGIEHLPATLNVVVQQYAMRKWILAGGALFLALVGCIGCIIFLRKAIKYKSDIWNDDAFLFWIISLALAVWSLLFFAMAFSATADAVSPIYSMIQDLS